MPIRIQRKRTRGWKMPENTVSVTRPGKFGNPFKVGDYYESMGYFLCIKTNEKAVELFKKRTVPTLNIEELRGKNLACWCKIGEPCHADILLQIANQNTPIKNDTHR